MLRRIRRTALAIGMAAALVCSGSSVQAADPVSLLLERKDRARASGFVVRDTWISKDNSLLLVTAYHVVRGATSLTAVIRVCKEGRPVDVAVGEILGIRALVWPGYDLAAVRLASPRAPPPAVGTAYVVANAEVYDQLRSGAREISFSSPLPARGQAVTIEAVAQADQVCPGGIGFVYETPAIDAQLEKLGAPSAVAARDARLIKYMSTAEPGASGGAVTIKGNTAAVLGVHSGGLVKQNKSWAVSLVGQSTQLQRPQEVELGAAQWPDGLDTSPLSREHEAIPESVVDTAARYERRAWTWLLAVGGFEDAIGRGGYKRGGYVLRLEAQSEIRAFPDSTHFAAIGAYGSLGLRFVEAQRVFVGPDGTQLGDIQTVPIRGYAAEFGGFLKLWRLASLRPSVSLGGRLSLLPLGADEPQLFLGAVVRGRLAFWPFDGNRVAVALEGMLAVDAFANLTRKYTGVGANLEPASGHRAAWMAGAGVAIEWTP